MNLTIHKSATAALVTGARPLHRFSLLTALTAAIVVSGGPAPVAGDGTAAANAGRAVDLAVGHTIKLIAVPGAAQGESRQVEVHLWYPADQRLSDLPKSVYSSRLYGVPLIPAKWDPLSWRVEGELAREGATIDPNRTPFPVIVFSHGSLNDPIDYAHTLERIAAAGFVVAAPSHVNNTQDDVRIDYVNSQAGFRLVPCNDGRPWPVECSATTVPRSMRDRVRDISYVLDLLPNWFGDRVDVSRAGVLGHSRGTVTALAAAGGSSVWGIQPELRVKAIMGLAIGAPAITFNANVADITVPTLLVSGKLDNTSRQEVSEAAFEQMEKSDEKAFVSIENATHRSFDATYCDQTRAAGAIAQSNSRAILDRHTLRGIVTAPTSGRAMDYCPFATFAEPTDIRPLVSSLLLAAGLPDFSITANTVPSTGLNTNEVKEGVKELAVAFFDTVLKRVGNDGAHFTRYLAPKWLNKHLPMVDRAKAVAGDDAICPPGQEVACGD